MKRRQRVHVFELSKRDDGRARMHRVRWRVDGRAFEEGFTHQRAARSFQARLLVAAQDASERWNLKSGEPMSWASLSDLDIATWARRYVQAEWATLEQSSRRSLVEALTRLVVVGAETRAPALRDELRAALVGWLVGQDAPDELVAWIERWSLPLADLDGPTLLVIDRALRVGWEGAELAPSTQRRMVGPSQRCLRAAVTAGLMDTLAWPDPPAGRARRKAGRRVEEARVVLAPESAETLLDAHKTNQPSSAMYATMAAVGLYAGLRPGEVVALEADDVELPQDGWGVIRVRQAWVGAGELWGDTQVGRTKTSTVREVPIPPVLVDILAAWMIDHDGALFRTREGNRPSESNWRRTLKAACARAGVEAMSPYDLRHTNASWLLAAGVAVPEAAARLGHSPETMMRYYVHAVEDPRAQANAALGRFLAPL